MSVPLELESRSTGLVYGCGAGTSYILCHQTMATSEQWVPDHDTFRPERWMRGHPQHQVGLLEFLNCDSNTIRYTRKK